MKEIWEINDDIIKELDNSDVHSTTADTRTKKLSLKEENKMWIHDFFRKNKHTYRKIG